jgi:hypothetical protein
LDEITAYLKSGANINISEVETGTELALTGILGIVSGELVIFPRASSDLEIVASATEVFAEAPKEEIAEKEWVLPERDSRSELLKYIISSLLVLAIIVSIYLYQKRRRTS